MKHFLAFLFLVGGVIGYAAPQLYTCGMHPQIIRTEPGDCPICGMKLTPVRDEAGTAARQITIDPVTIQRMNLKTAVVDHGPVQREIRAVGAVDYDERNLRDVTVKYEGWVEKLFVDATWTPVRAGDPLFAIYSPELYNAQLNFLVARRSDPEGTGPLIPAATDRLRLYDVPDEFITGLAQRGEPERTFTFAARTDGVVIEKRAVEGQMVKPGEVIFRLADLSEVWVQTQIYEHDLPFISVGQEAAVRVTFGPEREVAGRVSLITPQVNAATRTALARVVVANPDGFLRPGMFADVRFHARVADDALLVPDSAVLRSGERNTVFVALDGGRFEPRDVQLGARTDDYRYQVLAGLAAGERVVTSGQFMLDSESQLREAIQKMVHHQAGAAAPAADASPAPAATPASPAAEAAVGYICPMREHTPEPLPAPGKCPVCGMTLVPVPAAAAPAGHAH